MGTPCRFSRCNTFEHLCGPTQYMRAQVSSKLQAPHRQSTPIDMAMRSSARSRSRSATRTSPPPHLRKAPILLLRTSLHLSSRGQAVRACDRRSQRICNCLSSSPTQRHSPASIHPPHCVILRRSRSRSRPAQPKDPQLPFLYLRLSAIVPLRTNSPVVILRPSRSHLRPPQPKDPQLPFLISDSAAIVPLPTNPPVVILRPSRSRLRPA
jgi:hypothetical protein